MSNEQEWQRLQSLYAAMTDGELLRLAADKDGLREVAQQAIDAEMSKRGLEVSVEPEEQPLPDAAMSDLSAADDDPSLVTLLVSQSAVEANQAAGHLEDAEIPFELRPQRYRDTDDGPWKTSGLLEIVVERERKQDAVGILRKKMGLFPLAEVNEHDDAQDSGEEELYQVGNFELEEDAGVASKALLDAGIWYKAERIAVDPMDPSMECTFVEVRFDDLERALEVVEAAFDEAEQ